MTRAEMFSLLWSIGATHWGQQTFYISPPIDCAPTDHLKCSIDVARRQDNHRLLRVKVATKIEGSSVFAEQSVNPRVLEYNMD